MVRERFGFGGCSASVTEGHRTGTLWVVGTPIGNLGDATERSREVLGSVDVIAAEDTRRTGTLLERLGVARPRFVSMFEGNERERTVELLGELRAGRSVALVSDAGMPAVSDPGFRLVRAAGHGENTHSSCGKFSVRADRTLPGTGLDRAMFEDSFQRTFGGCSP